MVVLGDREWLTLHMEAYRGKVSGSHQRGRAPAGFRAYLAQVVWERIQELPSVVWLSPWKASTGEPALVAGGSYGGVDLPAVLADVMVAMRALRYLHGKWPEGFWAVRRSLEGKAAAADAMTLARAKYMLLDAVLEREPSTPSGSPAVLLE